MDETRGTRIAAAMADLTSVGHDERNQHGGYRYASKAAVYGAVRPVLAKHGLRIRTRGSNIEAIAEAGSTRGGVQAYRWRHTVEYALAAPEDLRDADLQWDERQSEMVGPADAKTMQALRSYNQRYWLEDVLLVDTADEVDVDQQRPEPSAGPKAPQRTPPPPQRTAATQPATNGRPNDDAKDALIRWAKVDKMAYAALRSIPPAGLAHRLIGEAKPEELTTENIEKLTTALKDAPKTVKFAVVKALEERGMQHRDGKWEPVA